MFGEIKRYVWWSRGVPIGPPQHEFLSSNEPYTTKERRIVQAIPAIEESLNVYIADSKTCCNCVIFR